MSFKPSLVDRALLAVAPERGLRRLQAKASAAQLMRAFDGASTDRRLSGWRASSSGPNAENDGALERLRYRARDLARNNRTVAAAALQFSGQTVGTGISPRAVDSRKTMRQKANDAWARFVDTCDPEGQQDYNGLLATTARALFVDGECLHRWIAGVDKRPFGRIKILEADHLDESRGQVPAANAVAANSYQGIDFDEWGARVGYWLFPVHPGETSVLRIPGQSVRVAAADVDHFFHVARPGQFRGISWLAPSIVALRGVDDVVEATIWRKRIEACIGLMIRTPEAQGAAPLVGQQKTDDRGRIEETLAPGKILRFGPGEEASTLDPTTSTDTVDFVRSQLYAFCATTGIPYHAITGDVSQANYSSLRAATLAGNVVLDMVQWLVLAPRVKAAWRRVMWAEAYMTGDERFKSVRCELSMPVRPWVDPVKEITAKVMEIRAGLQSMPDALAERGLDWEAQLAELQAFLQAADEAQIVLDTDPRKITHSGALQTAQAAQSVADGTPSDGNP
jgi:lambda family phage portal protein